MKQRIIVSRVCRRIPLKPLARTLIRNANNIRVRSIDNGAPVPAACEAIKFSCSSDNLSGAMLMVANSDLAIYLARHLAVGIFRTGAARGFREVNLAGADLVVSVVVGAHRALDAVQIRKPKSSFLSMKHGLARLCNFESTANQLRQKFQLVCEITR